MLIRFILNTTDEAALTSLRGAVGALRTQGHTVDVRMTFEGSDAERFGRRAVAEGTDLVIAGGGDGTVNEVLNGMLAEGAGRSAAELPRLGIVPLGTANDLAGWLGIPMDPAEAVRQAMESPARTVDVARVNDRFFLNVSTGGLGTQATEDAPERVKRVIGVFAYLAQGVKTFASLTPSSARFVADGELVHAGEFLLFAVGNGGRTGGGNLLTPRAEMDDGLLDLCIVLATTHGDLIRLLPDLRSGAHLGSEHIIYRQCASLQVVGGAELNVNADGESVDASTLNYAVVPGRVRLAVPPDAP